MEASEKVSPEAALRAAVEGLNEARNALFADGLTDEQLTETCASYTDALSAHDKACSAIGKSASK